MIASQDRRLRRRIIPVLIVMASLPVFYSLDAAPAKRHVTKPLTKKGRAAELPVVKKTGVNSLVVGDKRYEVNEFTVIIVNGEKAGLGDVKPGMQVSVAGGPREFGDTRAESLYKATRIVARSDNHLAKKAAEANKKVLEQNRKANRKTRKFKR